MNVSTQPRLTAPAGFRDILPQEQEYFTYIKKVVRHRCRQSGFRRISTSPVEHLETLQKVYGDSDDFFCTTDNKNNPLCFKPDGRVGIARAYVEHEMFNWPQPVELYYIETHLKNNPSARKNRMTCEVGVEVIGEIDPALIAQVLHLGYKILKDLGIAELISVRVNSMGCEHCRPTFIQELQNHFIGKERSLCANCLNAMQKDQVLKILECQEEDCSILARLAPKFSSYYCQACNDAHANFKEFMKTIGISFHQNDQLVRLPFYDGSIFEFTEKELEKKRAIGGGGRYDSLIHTLGGPQVGGVDLSLNAMEMIRLMKAEKIRVPSKDDLHVFVAQLGKEAKKVCLELMDKLKDSGIKTMGAVGKGSMREQLDLATKFKVPYMLLVGLTEVREKTIILRSMKKGTQKIIPVTDAIPALIEALGEDKLDLYSPGEVLY